jgi:beta-galactosidase
VALPRGVKAVWDLDKAYREATATRERICMNGLWRFKPAGRADEACPAFDEDWGYFKVPGTWPLEPVRKENGRSQLFFGPEGGEEKLHDVHMAWYWRRIDVPAGWKGRRIVLQAAWVNSRARVFIDGREAGEIGFPGGEADLTGVCRAGASHHLAILATAQPLTPQGTYLPYDEAPAERRVLRRGLCGDVFLASMPGGPRITDIAIDTSVRQWSITFTAALEGLEEGAGYVLRARVLDDAKEVLIAQSDPFCAADLQDGRLAFSKEWKAPKLWDTDTPGNQYEAVLELTEDGATRDAGHGVRFGFREFWIEGRDFILNGSRVHLRSAPLNSAQINTATASYEGACEATRRLKWWGYNSAYTHNYDCRPGSHIAFEEILRAADDTGMLLGFSLPHVSDYNWEGERPEERNGYERHLEWYVRCARNHPSVVMYSQNHNSTAHADDEDPQRMPLVLDCLHTGYLGERLRRIYDLESVLRRFDKHRILYNHSGPSRSMYTMNCYLNWTPMQERSEWFARWAEWGARPLCLVEYGEPYEASFMNLRGPWSRVRSMDLFQYQYTEWGAATRGDAAFDLHDVEKDVLRWEAGRFRRKEPFGIGDYPTGQGLHMNVPNLRGVQAEFIRHTWPYIRTLGLSGFNIWRELYLCFLRPGAAAGRVELDVDWERLQRPGFSPDFYEPSAADSMPYSMGTALADWEPNVRGAAFRRYNQPLLAYIAGGPERFTARGHNYAAGATVEKQFVVINDSRRSVECACEWSVDLPQKVSGRSVVPVEPGCSERILVRFGLPRSRTERTYRLSLKATFSTGDVQEDEFALHVLPHVKAPRVQERLALYDPLGQTAKLLDELGVRFGTVQAGADLSGYGLLVIGKKALTVGGAAPDLSAVPGGLKVVMFEQTREALEQRLGFRVQEWGLRRAFTGVPGHPVLAGLSDEHLRDWHGEATLIPPTLPPPDFSSYPTVEWCGFDTPRAGRAGNYGNVCSVMIEKPAAGDFLPLVEGGFHLQYSPLMVYREGKGMVLFCQADVTGRTEAEPAARRLAANIFGFADAYHPPAGRRALYAGEGAGLEHLKAAGAAVSAYDGRPLGADDLLVLAPGATGLLGGRAGAASDWISSGGRALALALSQDEVQAALGLPVTMAAAEHISCRYAPAGPDSPIAGVGCGEFMIRDPREVPLVTGGAEVVGDGVLAVAEGGRVVLCQLAPWQFDYKQFYNAKAAFRHLSFAVSRLLGNMGVTFGTPLLDNMARPAGPEEKRWLGGLYLEEPVVHDDDPYRFFRW